MIAEVVESAARRQKLPLANSCILLQQHPLGPDAAEGMFYGSLGDQSSCWFLRVKSRSKRRTSAYLS